MRKGVVGPILRDEMIFRWDDVTTDPKFAEQSPAMRFAAAHPLCGASWPYRSSRAREK